ncbi:MAG: hypothetical protein LUQ65_07960 [Candidatus Helarchaeota archaeon]|nr:hypothetical protein [Candidatus Helarchaeota archaeon]
MATRKIYFNGFLTNTDSSILKLSLQNGFKFEHMSGDETEKFISIIANIPPFEARVEITSYFPFLNMSEDKAYFISKSFDDTIESEKPELNLEINSLIVKFQEKYIYNYLIPTLSLLRLYKEGNISMPLSCFFFCVDDIPKPLIRMQTGMDYPHDSIFSLDDSEIKEAESFIQNIKLPFKEKSLQLAFENFDMSHGRYFAGIQFLLLMISMESLFSPDDKGEFTYRISRNSAVLIGKDKDDSKSVFNAMKKFYGKRSTIMHSGNSSSITKEDVLRLREFTRRSIKEFYKTSLSKKNLMDELDSTGFGEKPWLQKA